MVASSDGDFVANCYLHAEVRIGVFTASIDPRLLVLQADYQRASPYFHTWKGYDGVSYGMAFQRDSEAPRCTLTQTRSHTPF